MTRFAVIQRLLVPIDAVGIVVVILIHIIIANIQICQLVIVPEYALGF